MPPTRDDLPRHRLGIYRTREVAYLEPRPLRVGDDEMRLVNAQAAAMARPVQSRNDSRSGLPNRGPMRTFSDPGLAPGPDEGVLSVLADGGDTAPVVAVDGVPVSVGNGQLDLVLRAGPHTVEVQNTATLDPVVVQVAADGAHRVQFFEDRASGHRVLGDLPETIEFIPTNTGCWSLLVVTSLICCLPAGSVMALMPTETWHLVSGIGIAALAVAFIVAGVPLWRRAKARYHLDVAAQRRSLPREPVLYGEDAILLGANPTALPPLPAGMAAIDLHLECGRHLWAGRRKTGHGSFLSRAWTRPPRVLIDDTERPASRGHWRYLVPTGAQQLTVITDGRPANLEIPDRHTGRSEKQRDLVVEAHAGQTIQVNAEAHVYAIWRSATGDIESFEPRLWLEAV
ncbi:hypothetical protein [Glycomyces sp. YM15]|uniref:hypothetical protein n=1 Tax=Glycomyces sp. YM15 TaxID=2800446 RepID=UPI001965C1CE|nr:hypothetical protein [Glycomyces sp. YM15]